MEAIIKGKKISGKVAEILVNKGLATPVDGSEYIKPKKVVVKPKSKAKTPNPPKVVKPKVVKPKVKK